MESKGKKDIVKSITVTCKSLTLDPFTTTLLSNKLTALRNLWKVNNCKSYLSWEG